MKSMWPNASAPLSVGGKPTSSIYLNRVPSLYPWIFGKPLTISRLYGAPRSSIQEITFIRGLPFSSTGRVTDHRLVTATAMIADGDTFDSLRTFLVQALMVAHHSAGSCSAPPSGRKNSWTGAVALLVTRPC